MAEVGPKPHRLTRDALITACAAISTVSGFEYFVLSAGEDARRYLNEGGLAAFTAFRLFIILALAFCYRKQIFRLVLPMRLSLLIIFPLVLSAMWSTDPQQTLESSYRVLLACLCSFWVLAPRTAQECFDRMVAGAAFFVLVNALPLLLSPELAFMKGLHEGAFRGMFPHKNAFGFHMLFFVGILACKLVNNRKRYWQLLFVIAMIMLYMSHSSTSLVLAVASVLAVTFTSIVLKMVSERQSGLTIFVLTVVFAVIGAAATPLSGDLFAALGKDSSLTGRTDVWGFAIMGIQERPWSGYGFKGFWDVANSLISGYRGDNGWVPVHSHNSYLDLVLAVGFVGAAYYVVIAFKGIRLALAATTASGLIGPRLLPLVTLSLFFATSFLETIFPIDGTLVPTVVICSVGIAMKIIAENKPKVDELSIVLAAAE